MRGQPCVWCGGNNSLDHVTLPNFESEKEMAEFCPSGKTRVRNAWYGCCKDPSGGLHKIAFVDCCGTGYCHNDLIICNNWPLAKDWCSPTGGPAVPRTGPLSYYCTVVLNYGPCDDW